MFQSLQVLGMKEDLKKVIKIKVNGKNKPLPIKTKC